MDDLCATWVKLRRRRYEDPSSSRNSAGQCLDPRDLKRPGSHHQTRTRRREDQMQARNRNVLVVGCGLGGATAAAALAQRGISVDVIERRTAHAASGIGLTLGGNALRALDEIGALETITASGVSYDHMDFCDNNGDPLYSAKITFGGGRIPASVSMSRPDLHQILVELAREAGASIQMGTTITELDQGGSQVTVQLSDGAARTYDAVLGSIGRASYR